MLQALLDGEIQEIENPDDPDGPSLFKFTTYKASEGTKHKKKIEWDKAKSTTDTDGLDFTFDDVDMGWGFKDSGKTLRAIAGKARADATRISSLSASSSGPSGGGGLGHGNGGGERPVLALEDAKERDKVMLKVEEAVRGCGQVLLKSAKTLNHLPASGMGKRSKDMLVETMGPVQQFEDKLKYLTIHGTLPGESKVQSSESIKAILKDYQGYFNDLKQALDMASPLLKPVSKAQAE